MEHKEGAERFLIYFWQALVTVFLSMVVQEF